MTRCATSPGVQGGEDVNVPRPAITKLWWQIKNYWNPLKYPTERRAGVVIQPVEVDGFKASDCPQYPPFDKGLPAHPVEFVMEKQLGLIHKIQLSSGMDDARFDELIRPIIRNYAEYVHLLPATEASNHRGAGGLFRFGLEVGFYAYQASDGVMFSGRESTEKRRIQEPVWRYASLIAGLCGDLYRPLTDLMVVNEEGDRWPSEEMSLYKWTQENKVRDYHLRWIKSDRHSSKHSVASLLIHKIVPSHCITYIRNSSESILPAMMDTIIDMPGVNNILHQLVINARHKVIERDHKKDPSSYGKLTLGAHLEPHLIDAMRRLVRSGTWVTNVKKSDIWYSSEGAFLVWKKAAADIVDVLSNSKMPGIPKDPDTLADIFLHADMIDLSPAGSVFWGIYSPISGVMLEAVKLSDPAILFGDDDPPPVLDVSLLMPGTAIAGNVLAPESEFLEQSAAKNVSQLPLMALRSTANSPETVGLAGATSHKDVRIAAGKEEAASLAPKQSHARAPTKTTAARAAKASPTETARATMMQRMSPLVKEALSAIFEDFQQKKSSSPVFNMQHGLAISLKELGSHGADVMRLMGELDAAKWLWLDPNAQGAKFTTLEHGGEPVDCIVLEARIAKIFGL